MNTSCDRRMTVPELVDLIRDAGRIPVERDNLYNEMNLPYADEAVAA